MSKLWRQQSEKKTNQTYIQVSSVVSRGRNFRQTGNTTVRRLHTVRDS